MCDHKYLYEPALSSKGIPSVSKPGEVAATYVRWQGLAARQYSPGKRCKRASWLTGDQGVRLLEILLAMMLRLHLYPGGLNSR